MPPEVAPPGMKSDEIVTAVTEVSLPSADHLRLELSLRKDQILSARLSGVGCREMLALLKEWRPKISGRLAQLPLPQGVTHPEMLLRELLQRAKGEWQPPYHESEICHCRSVATSSVDTAIVLGCHSLEEIRRSTSANTSCGACRPDVESLIAYRLGRRGPEDHKD